MNEKEIVKEIMKEKNVRNADLSAWLQESPQTTWRKLNGANKSLVVNGLNDMLFHLGYDLVIMPRGKAGRIEGAYVVDNTAKPKEKKAPEKVAEKEMTEKAE